MNRPVDVFWSTERNSGVDRFEGITVGWEIEIGGVLSILDLGVPEGNGPNDGRMLANYGPGAWKRVEFTGVRMENPK